MSQVGRLTAAIEKLEEVHRQQFVHSGWLCEECDGEPHPLSQADVDVIPYRTIPTQLVILRHALARAELKLAYGGLERASFDHTIADAVALADAILGGAS